MEGRWTCRCGRENPVALSSCPRCGRRIQLVGGPAAAGQSPTSGHGEAPLDGGQAPMRAGSRFGLDPATKPLLIGLAGVVLVVGALVLGALALRTLTKGKSDAPAGTAANPRPAAFDTVEQVVGQLEDFVERARGLQFKSPVKVSILKDGPFIAKLRASSSPDIADLTGQEATLRALRLLPDGVNLAQQREAELDRVLGFYDPATKELYVKGVGTTPYVRYVLVHELTHALQDQHFNLERVGADNNDARLAARAVIEGDAERTMRSYLSTLSAFEQDAVQREARSHADDIYNQAYVTSFDNFPYVVGKAWNDAVRGNGGQSTLDNAFRTFPRSSAEIIHPDRYLAGIGPEEVSPPAADGPIIDQGVVGEYQLIYLLARAIDDQDAFDIAQAWGGSRYVTWRSGAGSCTRVRFTMLSAAANQALAQALDAWAETTGATVEGNGPVTLSACTGQP